MVMLGQVVESWTACLWFFSASIRMSAAFFRSASDSMGVSSGWAFGRADGPLYRKSAAATPLLQRRLLAGRIGPAQRRRQHHVDVAADWIAHIGAELERLDPPAQH